MISIRPAERRDEDAIWEIFHAVVQPGDTYAFPAEMSRRDALAYWLAPSAHTYVAVEDEAIVGTYVLKTQPARTRSHVSNAAFMVSLSAQGRGVGRRMGEHCLAEARRLDSARCSSICRVTNEPAVALWKKLV
jgi:ribosomal protein S18 acetylase RimI-like enzyme